ncbi:MAG: YbhB/YbcL family Raf kinase inhibitor-like protein [Defluviicoccus sp.]
MTLTLTSPAFKHGERIPAFYTCEGKDLSPPLAWTGAPAGTRSFALVCSDPDAPAGTWYHWAIFDLGAEKSHLDAGFPRNARAGAVRQAISDFKRPGYGGPCPPKGHGPHHYHFRLFALGVASLKLAEAAHCRDVERAAEQQAFAKATLTGLYER